MFPYICLLLLTGFGVLFAHGSVSCVLRDGGMGECRLLHECPEVLKHIRNRFGDPAAPVRCGFEGNEEIVCCNKPSKTTTASPEGGDDVVVFGDPDEDTWRPPAWHPTQRTQRPGQKPLLRATPKPAGPSAVRPTRKPWSTTTESETPYIFQDDELTQTVPIGERIADKKCKEYVSKKDWVVNTHILNGDAVQPGEFPHMAALGYPDDEKGLKFSCGGALVSELFVLTAAHCLVNSAQLKPTVVRLGVTELNGTFDTLVTDYPVEKDYIHEKYNHLKKLNDIAILRLGKTVTFSVNIYPACLNLDPENPKATLIITGWGKINAKEKDSNNELLRASVAAVATAKCNVAYDSQIFRANNPTGYLPSQLCAQDPKKKSDTCPGDSGGPLQMAMEGTDDMYILIGVTSFGKNCGVDAPGVYTRVASFADWIEKIVWP